MPDMPSAEVEIDLDLIRGLVEMQALSRIPAAATLPLAKAAEGWDSELWRLGDRYAVRLPRRALSAPLVLNEQRTLDLLAPRIGATGLGVPTPLVHGTPALGFPWAWSVVPWFDGSRGLDIPRHRRSGWAPRLGEALLALHRPAPHDHPVNPVRGVPLAERSAVVAERFALLRESALAPAGAIDRAAQLWDEGLAAAPWERPPVWIHGDLHPGNLIARDGELVALIDFGDVTAGDPAYDLAIAWLAFDASGRRRLREVLGAHYDAATWVRAKAWAAAMSTLLLVHSDDNPDYASLGQEALEELRKDEAPASSSNRTM